MSRQGRTTRSGVSADAAEGAGLKGERSGRKHAKTGALAPKEIKARTWRKALVKIGQVVVPKWVPEKEKPTPELQQSIKPRKHGAAAAGRRALKRSMGMGSTRHEVVQEIDQQEHKRMRPGNEDTVAASAPFSASHAARTESHSQEQTADQQPDSADNNQDSNADNLANLDLDSSLFDDSLQFLDDGL